MNHALATSTAEAEGTSVDADPTGPAPRARRNSAPARVAAALAVLVVTFVHFRPWQGGLLEDWGFAAVWDSEGLGGLATRFSGVAGRPLHLVPGYLGMALSDGGFVGQYAILALVAVGQLALAYWATSPWRLPRPVRATLAVLVALHPWWAAGDILRFLPAQVAVLATVLWFGAALRFLTTGRRTWLLVVGAAPVVGLLTYQAPAGAILLGSVAVALAAAPTRRQGATLVAVTAGAVGLALTWSVAIAPRLFPASYESQLLGAPAASLRSSVRTVLRTLVLHAPATVGFLVLVALLVIALGFHQRHDPRTAWAFLAMTAVAPATALIYASQPLHLNDPERLSLPVGLTLWLILCALSPALSSAPRFARAASSVLLVVALALTAHAYLYWASYSTAQRSLIDVVEAAGSAPGQVGRQIVVADDTGRYGDVYLLLPPHLQYALVAEGSTTTAVLCTPDTVARQHPVAGLFPLSTTEHCSAFLGGNDVESLGTVQTTLGPVRLFSTPIDTP